MYQKMLLSEKVAETIMTSIKNDFYKVGDQMPNEIQLAEELGVSRATLREAIKILISRKVLEVKRGIGTFVSEKTGDEQDDFSLKSLNIYAQKMEILRIMKHLDEEELQAFQHLSWNDQQTIKSRFESILHVEKNKIDMDLTNIYITGLLETIEIIALRRHSSFKHRLIKQTHEAVKIFLETIVPKEGTIICQLITNIVEALGQDEVVLIFDEFMMQLGFYLQEE